MWHVHGDVQTGVFPPEVASFFGRVAGLVPPHCVVFLPELLKRSARFKRFDLRWHAALCCGWKSATQNPHTGLREGGRASHVHISIQSIIINEQSCGFMQLSYTWLPLHLHLGDFWDLLYCCFACFAWITIEDHEISRDGRINSLSSICSYQTESVATC